MKMKQRKSTRIISFVLGICMVMGLVSGIPMSVHAEGEKTVACLGTNAIKAPTPPESADSSWQGSYVYYGKIYNYKSNRYESLMYRVLSPDTTDFGGRTMLVDCNQTIIGLYSSQSLNGSDFLEKEGVFTSPEKSAISNSVIESYEIDYSQYEGFSDSWKTAYTALNGDKIFYLDMIDLLNPAYGFSNTAGPAVNRKKKDSNQLDTYWWTRSESVYNKGTFIDEDGAVKVRDKENIDTSPAFNVNLDKVIFSSVIPGTGNVGADGTEYKLTILDEGLSIALQDEGIVSVSDDLVEVPYCISGDNKDNTTQVSVLILDKAYNANDTANTNILYYGKMNNSQGFSTTGTGIFSLPEDLFLDGWGTEYFVYMLAEDVNGVKETDYACYPVGIPAPQSSEVIYGEDDIVYSINNSVVDYDGTPHNCSITVSTPQQGVSIKYGTTKDVYNLDECPSFTEPGYHRVYFRIEADEYNTVTGSFLFTIKKLEPYITKAPVQARPVLYYLKEGQKLIEPGTAEGGTILYSLGNNYSEDIPVGYMDTKYTINYYVKGDTYHNDSKVFTINVEVVKAKESDLDSALSDSENYYNELKNNEEYTNILNELKKAIDDAKALDTHWYVEKIGETIYSLNDATEPVKEVVDTIKANEVTGKINALPTSNNVTTADKNAIEATRAAYDALTDDQKAKISDDILKKLTNDESALAKAIENANKKPSNNNANQSSGSKKTDTNKNNTDNTKKTSYSNEWVDGKWYDKNGKQSYKYKGSWKKNSKGWWFEDENEWCPYSQWQKIDGKWYYFTGDGYMDYSEYRDGCWLGSDGAWVEAYSNGTWHYSVKGWWYSDGSWYAADQDLWIDGTKYHFNSKGYWKE